MRRVLAVIVAMITLYAPQLRAEAITSCTQSGTYYCVNAGFLPAIQDRVVAIRALLAMPEKPSDALASRCPPSKEATSRSTSTGGRRQEAGGGKTWRLFGLDAQPGRQGLGAARPC
jgi:hypothetical protein